MKLPPVGTPGRWPPTLQKQYMKASQVMSDRLVARLDQKLPPVLKMR